MYSSVNYRSRAVKPPPTPFLARIPWGSLLVFVILFGGGGWGYYHFIWMRRLPQDYALASPDGRTQQVRLEARNDSVLKYTLLSDNSTHYASIASLPDEEQAFIKELPAGLQFNLPFSCVMREKGVPAAPIRVEGRNADWVHYTLLSDLSPHYVRLSAFSADDQLILTQLPPTLTIEAPLKIAVHDKSGQVLNGEVAGRSADVVKLAAADGTVTYYPLSEIASLDLSLIRLLPTTVYLRFPLDCTLTGADGQKMNVQLLGHVDNLLKYHYAGNTLIRYAFETDFSPVDREVFHFLPNNINLTYPLEVTLSDAKGQALPVRLDGRTADLVKFNQLDSGKECYWLMKAFSPASRKFLSVLPLGLQLSYPIDTTLTSPAGASLEAHILGRDTITVNFQTPDGKTYTYPINKFSADSQQLLNLLPEDLPQAVRQSNDEQIAKAEAAKEQLKNLRQELANLLIADVATLKSGDTQSAEDQSAPISSSNAIMGKLDVIRDQVETLCKQIDPLLDKTPAQGSARDAQVAWAHAMTVIKEDDQIRKSIAEAVGESDRQGERVDLRRGQADLIKTLNQINADVGTYAP